MALSIFRGCLLVELVFIYAALRKMPKVELEILALEFFCSSGWGNEGPGGTQLVCAKFRCEADTEKIFYNYKLIWQV